MNLVYDGYNFDSIQQNLGERPGGYRVDPFYLRKGMANKPYFWNDETKKWERVRLGDMFRVTEEGKVVRYG